MGVAVSLSQEDARIPKPYSSFWCNPHHLQAALKLLLTEGGDLSLTHISPVLLAALTRLRCLITVKVPSS